MNVSIQINKMSAPRVYFDPRTLLHSGPDDAMELPTRLEWAKSAYTTTPLVSTVTLLETKELIQTVHGADYFERVMATVDVQEWTYFDDGETFYNEFTLQAATIAALAAAQLARELVSGDYKSGFALVRPPGHHAFKNPEGFCIFNNTAIAAEAALAAGAEKVFIFDWDLHHGNGIQDYFYVRANVFYASMHGQGIYPGTGPAEEHGAGPGSGFTLNIPLKCGTGHSRYLQLFKEQVLPALVKYAPSIVLIAAGFDAMQGDPMNFLQLSPNTYASILSAIREEMPNVPIGLILEGGYRASNIQAAFEKCIGAL